MLLLAYAATALFGIGGGGKDEGGKDEGGKGEGGKADGGKAPSKDEKILIFLTLS